MPIEVLMPALSPTMKSGTIRKWYKLEGESVKSGDVIADIETDKAVMEFEYADEDGIMGKILFAEGSKDIAVNELIALVAVDEEDLLKIASYEKSSAVSENQPVEMQVKQHVGDRNTLVTSTQRVKISPLARKMALDLSIDINSIQGTGPYGRIIKSDILNAVSEQKNYDNSSTDVKSSFTEISSMRKIIAERLVYSKQTIPHFYISMDCIVDNLLKLRLEINSENPDAKVTVNDFIIKAVAMSVKKFPKVNVSWSDNKIIIFSNIDVSVAVSIDDGLITPIVRDADKKSLMSISSEVKTLVDKARSGRLRPEEFQGGSVTISNLGMFGVKKFNAIVNPPQSCIIAIGCSEKRPVVIDNTVCISNIMTVALSVDHRVIDGVLAAKFLSCFKHYLEKPFLMLI